jgi:hypothetical protein
VIPARPQSSASPSKRTVAALSVLAFESTGSTAQIIGTVSGENREWLLHHLATLEGDIVLDCQRGAFVDAPARTMLVEYAGLVRARGNQLTMI